MTASDETWHHGIIAAACSVYEECSYLELGVSAGACLAAVAPHAARATGVDPKPPRRAALSVATFILGESDDYFANLDPATRHHVIFIDGDHRLEQAARDLRHSLDYLETGGVIFLHDTYPLSKVDTRLRVACGEVYRLAAELSSDDRLELFTWTRFPGLTMIRRRGEPIGARSSVVAP